jgi:hypothetical protein
MANRRDKLDNSNPFARNPKVPTLAELTNSMLAPVGARPSVEGGNIRVGNFLLTSTGLTINGQISHEEWQQMGEVLHRLDGAIQWLIGDWLVYGERVWGETYEQIAELTGISYQTLRDYAWVARNVDLSLRKDNLTFNHHKLVTSMEPATQRQWLEHAAEQGLSISQMKAAIEGKVPPTLSDGKDPVSKFERVFLPFQQRIDRILSKAGQGDRRKIANWLRQEADRIERGDA